MAGIEKICNPREAQRRIKLSLGYLVTQVTI
jgi:hypothetical protein